MIKKSAGAISLLCTALLLAAPPAAAQEKKTLTISSWGGAFQKAQKEAWFGIVEKELNVTIKEDTTSGIADVRTQVASGKPSWDLTTQGAYSCALLEKEGRLEKFDAETTKALGRHPDEPRPFGALRAADRLFRCHRLAGKGLPGKEPTGWASFWDAKSFPANAPSASIRSMRSRWP